MTRFQTLLLVLGLAMTFHVHANAQDLHTDGNETGNGGYVFDKGEPAPGSEYQLYDYVEYGKSFDPRQLPEYVQYVKPRLDSLAKKLPNVAAFVDYMFGEGGATWFFVDYDFKRGSVGSSQPINTNLVLTYERVQAAATYPERNATQINEVIWNKLQPEARAYLLVHEMLWMAELSEDAYNYFDRGITLDKLSPSTTGEKIRILTGLLLSVPFQSKDAYTMFKTINKNSAHLKHKYDWFSYLKNPLVKLNYKVSDDLRLTNKPPIALLAYLDTIAQDDSSNGTNDEAQRRLNAENCIAQSPMLNKGAWRTAFYEMSRGTQYDALMIGNFGVVISDYIRDSYINPKTYGLVHDLITSYAKTPSHPIFGIKEIPQDAIGTNAALPVIHVRATTSGSNCVVLASPVRFLRIDHREGLNHEGGRITNLYGIGNPVELVQRVESLSSGAVVGFRVHLNQQLNQKFNEPSVDMFFPEVHNVMQALAAPAPGKNQSSYAEKIGFDTSKKFNGQLRDQAWGQSKVEKEVKEQCETYVRNAARGGSIVTLEDGSKWGCGSVKSWKSRDPERPNYEAMYWFAEISIVKK